MLTTTSHDSVFLRADNSLIDMNYHQFHRYDRQMVLQVDQ